MSLPHTHTHTIRRYVALGCAALMLALALVRTYAWLAITSVLGDIAVTSGLVRAGGEGNP